MASENDTPEEVNPDEDVGVTFADLGLDPKILKALGDIGYTKPTPIQARAIPPALQNRDVLGIAQTGTGKTGAFTLPTVHKLAKGRARARMPRCLIVCPTRELAAQVEENVVAYGKYLKLEMALLIGGVSFGEQDAKLQRGVDVLIATPGRLLDQFERGKILLTGVQTLVVDEADRMLDMGFIPDIERIFQLTPFTRQVLFFSATMPNEIKRLVDQFLHQPVTIQVARRNMTADTVRERIVRLPTSDAKQKREALRWLIDNLGEELNDAGGDANGIIFCNRKRDVDTVAKSLNKGGYKAAPIHGDLAQSLRTKTLDKFKSGELQWLVASDVAARGLDIPDVSFVFNYDVPHHSEDYVHRIGRTGRAGKKGEAVMLVCRLDEKNYDGILDLVGREEIEEIKIGKVSDKSPRRSSGAKSSKSKSSDLKPKSSEESKPRKKAGESRRKAPGKRKAPDREAKAETVEAQAEKATEDASKRSRGGRGRSSAKGSGSSKGPSKSSDSFSRGSSKGARNEGRSRGGRGRRNELEPVKNAGFGDSVPDFFKR